VAVHNGNFDMPEQFSEGLLRARLFFFKFFNFRERITIMVSAWMTFSLRSASPLTHLPPTIHLDSLALIRTNKDLTGTAAPTAKA
jgi:hypothetical protein